MSQVVVIQIGNSDNKLTQNEWAHFAAAMHLVVSSNVYRIHFKGGSDWDAPWQNACWVAELGSNDLEQLKAELRSCRASHQQDSVALTIGDTELI